MKRVGDKLNITFGDKHATIRGYFYYEGDTYTFADAAGFGVTYDSWINYNTGTISKFGGLINTSEVNQNILDNGYRVVFELIDKSENTPIRCVGDSIYIDNKVRIVWKDYDHPSNKFEVYNNTVTYLTDDGGAFHGTLIYDPIVDVGNVSIGVFNQTYYNGTGIIVNASYTQGDYMSQVFQINNSVDSINLTTHTTSIDGYAINVSVREYNMSSIFTDNIILWISFDDSNNDSIIHQGEGTMIETSGDYWNITRESCKEELCLRPNDDYMNTRIEYPSTHYLQNFTMLLFTNRIGSDACSQLIIGNLPNYVKFFTLYDSSNYVSCKFDQYPESTVSNTNYGKWIIGQTVMIGCVYNGTHLSSVFDGKSNPNPTAHQQQTNFSTIWIGNDQNNNFVYNGTIDNIMIFNKSLSAEELLEINNSYPRWQPFKTFQPLETGESAKNFSISKNTTFVQAKYELFADGTDSPTLNNFSLRYLPSITISNATISPSIAYVTNNLNCSIIATSSLGEDLTVEFTWYNDTLNTSFANATVTCTSGTTCYSTSLFGSYNHSHNGNVTCSARALSGELTTGWLNTTKFINNTIPSFEVGSISILPTSPTVDQDLQCNWTTSNLHDADNDTLTIVYDWANSTNGIDFTWLGNNTVNLTSTNTSTDQYWKCRAGPVDDWSIAPNVTSASVLLSGVANDPPVVNDVNITTNDLTSNATYPTNNNSYILIGVDWTDVDGDNTSIHICKTDSFSGGRCDDGSYGLPIANSTNLTPYLNYTLGNFTEQDNTLYVYAISNNSLTSSSKSQTFEVNFPPSIPQLSSPSDATEYASTVTEAALSWSSSTDSNSDSIRYILYGDQKSIPTANLSNTTGTTYTWTGLSTSNTYYWKVLAIDEHGYSEQSSSTSYFSVASGDSGTSSGGGTTIETVDEQAILQAARENICGNKICEDNETRINCPEDCAFGTGWNLEDVTNCFFGDEFDRCVLREAPVVTFMLTVLAIAVIVALVIRSNNPKLKKLKLFKK